MTTTHPTLTARVDVTLLRGQNNREHHRVPFDGDEAARHAARDQTSSIWMRISIWRVKKISSSRMIGDRSSAPNIGITRRMRIRTGSTS